MSSVCGMDGNQYEHQKSVTVAINSPWSMLYHALQEGFHH